MQGPGANEPGTFHARHGECRWPPTRVVGPVVDHERGRGCLHAPGSSNPPTRCPGGARCACICLRARAGQRACAEVAGVANDRAGGRSATRFAAGPAAPAAAAAPSEWPMAPRWCPRASRSSRRLRPRARSAMSEALVAAASPSRRGRTDDLVAGTSSAARRRGTGRYAPAMGQSMAGVAVWPGAPCGEASRAVALVRLPREQLAFVRCAEARGVRKRRGLSRAAGAQGGGNAHLHARPGRDKALRTFVQAGAGRGRSAGTPIRGRAGGGGWGGGIDEAPEGGHRALAGESWPISSSQR